MGYRFYISLLLIFYSFFLLSPGGNCQELFRVPAAFQAMGHTGASLESPVALFWNPAGTAGSELAGGILYSNRFLLDDLSTSSVFLILPFQKNRFLFTFSRFGSEGFQEDKFSAGLSRRLSPAVSAALQFHYFSLFLAENERRHGRLLADLGIQLRFGELGLGLQYFNPYGISTSNNRLPAGYPWAIRLGAHKNFQESFLLTAELYREQHASIEPRFGMQYLINNQLSLRCGLEAQTGNLAMGLGYLIKTIQTDIAFSYHQYLGLSPSVTIYYQRK
ncbi:hypothetical protein [Gaoshiqia sp. Z1-71]|uniref:hypothetical protein n=1 Tax=Gaoshiqia hydrogeniformans TaxID=3290090 RepID=UPI003BF8853A